MTHEHSDTSDVTIDDGSKEALTHAHVVSQRACDTARAGRGGGGTRICIRRAAGGKSRAVTGRRRRQRDERRMRKMVNREKLMPTHLGLPVIVVVDRSTLRATVSLVSTALLTAPVNAAELPPLIEATTGRSRERAACSTALLSLRT